MMLRLVMHDVPRLARRPGRSADMLPRLYMGLGPSILGCRSPSYRNYVGSDLRARGSDSCRHSGPPSLNTQQQPEAAGTTPVSLYSKDWVWYEVQASDPNGSFFARLKQMTLSMCSALLSLLIDQGCPSVVSCPWLNSATIMSHAG
jgi:hypothetical protein